MVKEVAPDIFDQVLAGQVTIPEAKRQVRARQRERRIDDGASSPLSEQECSLMEAYERGETLVIDMEKHYAVLKRAEAEGRYVRVDRMSKWGNPFEVGKDGDRDHCLDGYELYFTFKRSLHGDLPELRGKVLGCHCYPERCHGSYLKGRADETSD